MKIITRVTKTYTNCNDCPNFIKPDENGVINIKEKYLSHNKRSAYKITINKEIINKEGISIPNPNPILGVCDETNLYIYDVKLPIIHPNNKTAYECYIEFPISENSKYTEDNLIGILSESGLTI